MSSSLAAANAQAQESGQQAATAVLKKSRPEFETIPLHVGAFNVTVSGKAQIHYDDNIYATRTDVVDDVMTHLSGSVAAQSTWSHHALSLQADAALAKGLNQTDEDTQTYAAQATLQLDLSIDTRLTPRIGYSRAYEVRGSIGDTSIRGPRIRYNTLSLGSILHHTAGRLILETEGELETFRYGDKNDATSGTQARNRNFRSWYTSLRAGYALLPGAAVFVEGSYNQARYPDEAMELDRSSKGYSLKSGMQFGVTRLMQGRIGLGYQNQKFDDPAYPRIKGLDFNTSLEWSPTRLITWSLDAKRSIQRSPIVNVAGVKESQFATRIDYEFRYNLILSGRLSHTISNFSGAHLKQNDTAVGVQAEWLLNRHMRLSSQVGMQRTRSEGNGRHYDRKQAFLTFQYSL